MTQPDQAIQIEHIEVVIDDTAGTQNATASDIALQYNDNVSGCIVVATSIIITYTFLIK